MSEIISELQQLSEEVRIAFGVLSPAQINWKPSADVWSVGQCFEHLIKTNESYFGELDQVVAGTRKNSFWEKWSPLTPFAGKLLINSLKSEGRKVKTIEKMTPPSEIRADIIEIFAAHQTELIEKVRQCESADWQKIVLTSPFAKMMTYNLADGLKSIVEHERRHFRQAERVVQAEGFPK
jgi:uncharacterized damage-inducible protein DinB